MVLDGGEKRNVFSFHAPSSILLAGPTMAGKTSLTMSILRNADTMYKVPPKHIIYCYGVYQRVFSQLEDDIANLTLHHGLPSTELIENIGSEEPEDHSIIILDDLLDSVCESRAMCQLFIRNCHHLRISVIFITQNLYHQAKYSRTINLNSSYLILMKTCRDLQQIHYLSRQMDPSTPKRLLEAYECATSRPWGYLVVNNLTATGDDDIRLSSCILPWEDLVLYVKRV
jgi:hypothetical protein